MTSDAIPASVGAVLTVDVGAVVANWLDLAGRMSAGGAAGADCSAVVKANAYGLGAVQIVPALAAAGCRRFFVAQLEEAAALDGLLPKGAVAVLNGLLPGCEDAFVGTGVVPVLNQLAEVDRWAAAARALGRRLPAYVHVDTGMNRLGLGPDELDTLVAEPGRLEGIDVLAWMSHLASADEPSHPINAEQLARFRAALRRLPRARASFANSSGIFLGPDYHFDLARPGCALYGVNPTPGRTNPMRPVIRLMARVLQVRNVDSHMTVGYGAAHSIARKGKVATIAVGYADGYDRALSGAGFVLAGGVPAPIVGRVSMDLITVDVTDVPRTPCPGDFVELIGDHRPVDQVAREAGTIGYEILTSLGDRYHRFYLSTKGE